MIRPVAADGRIETGGAFTPIHRPRVVERIQSAATQRIVLIVAPAGYGKSVALRQYLETLQDEHVRYDVRSEQGTLLGFVRGFADVLVDIAPDARKTLSGAYEKSQSSKTPGADLAMWMHAHIKTFTGVIAIDDLHVAENDPEISRFLVSLIDRTKGRTKWIIASRSSLDLPVGSWLAYGEMDLNIDEEDLRFTIDEARQTAKSSRLAVRDDELEQILSMTEGWPTAISFALRSSTRSMDLRNIAASTREMIYRFLAEQVYESLENDERELLQFVAYLPEIDLEVLRHAGYSKAKAVVEALRDRVAFIYVDRPNVYRCHDLFRDFLQHQLELEGDSAVEKIQRRVAAALEERGDVASALKIYTSLHAEKDVLRLLEAHGFALIDRAHGDAVADALEQLPQESRAVHPMALALRAVREAHNGRFDRAESLFQRALKREISVEISSDIAIRLATMLFNQRREIAPLLEPLLEGPFPDESRVAALSLLMLAYANAGRRDQVLRAIADAQQYAASVDSNELRARLLYRMALAKMTLAFPAEEVTTLFLEAQALAIENALYLTGAAALLGLAYVAMFYDDDITKSVWYAQQSANAAQKAGDRYSMQNAVVHLMLLESIRGGVERLPVLEQQFLSVTTSDSGRTAYIVPTRAMMASWEGRFDEAHRLGAMWPEPVYDFDRVHAAAIRGIYALGADKKQQAQEYIARALSMLETAQLPHVFARRRAELARMLCAIAEAFMGRVTNANRIMQRVGIADGPAVDAMKDVVLAVCRMVKNRSFTDDVVEALQQLRSVGHGGLSKTLERLVERFVSSAQHAETLLTKAELDVLHELGHGRSPKEIATMTGRSVYTVQAHIQNIIRKLGCSGRNEAMTVARKRGLLA